MTKEQAIALWEKLAPLDAMVAREHNSGAGDPEEYEVLVWARRLSNAQLVELAMMVKAEGLEMTLETEDRPEPVYAVFKGD